MKITIEYDDNDKTQLRKVEFLGDCSTPEDFADTLLTLVDTTDFCFSAVVAKTLKYTSGDSQFLRKAIERWLEDNKECDDEDETLDTTDEGGVS